MGVISRETYLAGIAKGAAAMSNMAMTVENAIAEDKKVSVMSASEATLPNGDMYRNNYHFLFLFDGNKIRRVHAFLNTKTAEEKLMPVLWGDQRNFS